MNCYKILQKQFYSLLSSRWGLAFVTCTILLLLISIIQFGEILLEWSIEQYEVQFSLYRDNIAGRSFEKQFTPDLPIDIVYTWVNGSDPILLGRLEQLKRQENSTDDKDDVINTSCPFLHCFSCDAVIMRSDGRGNLTSHDVKSHLPLLAEAHVIQPINSSSDGLVYYVRLSTEEQVNITLNSSNSSLFRRAFLTVDTSLHGLYKLPDVAIVINHSKNTLELPGIKELVYKKVGVSVAYYNPGILDHVINGSLAWKPPANITVYPAYLLWQPFKLPFVANSNGSNITGRDDISGNRFYDNEELRYSLRSVERYTPWIRNIYIVTNGQIPSWIKIDHPRLTIVSHDEIFTNHSHLPTFSSPAIETHIHRIPGLSNHFIYLNDDVMFGDDVWPEDFVTDFNRYKIYMAWSVPYCAEGCPPNWINDKYCDRACNNSMCDFDGEDCKNKTSYGSSYSQWQGSQQQSKAISSAQCSSGCIPTWLGDRYCDHVCRVPECGYDTGDCGTDDYHRLYGVMLSPDRHYIIPSGVKALYFNLSEVFSNHTVTSSEMSSNSIVTAAVVSQKFKVLTMVFTDKVNRTMVAVKMTGTDSSSNKTQVMFNVTVDTSVSLISNGTYPPYSYPHFNTTDQHFLEMISMTIQNSNRSINFWVTERLATPSTSTVELAIPLTINTTELPANVSERLEQLQKEFDDGDLTEQGLVKRRNVVLSSYLNTSSEKQSHLSQRKLLAVADTELADWIGDSKMKQSRLTNDMKRAVQQWEWVHGPWHSDYNKQQYKGKFPWEKATGDNRDTAPHNDYTLPRRRGRHLMDTFADSLRYVNKLYNKMYGYVARKVPAHMPHMINKEIMQRLQDIYPEEYEQTSSHKLRTVYDMQFSFSYFYFVISDTRNASIDEIFQELDLDQSGILSIRELRTLMAKLYDLPIYLETIEQFEDLLRNCSDSFKGEVTSVSEEEYQSLYDSNLPLVTEEFLLQCHSIVEKINATMVTRKRYKTEELGEDDVSFKMINENASLVLQQLDWIRKNKRKFICINDNINHDTDEAEMARMVLRDFYESMFPLPSQFELPHQYRNRFLYLWEFNQWKQEQETREFYFRLSLVVMMLLMACLFFYGKLVQLRRKLTSLLPRRHREHMEC